MKLKKITVKVLKVINFWREVTVYLMEEECHSNIGNVIENIINKTAGFIGQ